MVKFIGSGHKKITSAILLTSMLLATTAHAQNFEAFVDNGNLAVGQTVNVKLELTGVTPTGVPDTSQLPQGLKITGQSQESQIVIVNGKQQGSISWIYNILPSREGTYAIPEMPINTEAGVFYTRPFKITVKDAGSLPAETPDKSVFMEANIDKDMLYAGQPTILTVKIYSKYQLNNADLKKPVSDGMLIDQIGKPKISTQTLNGIAHNVVTIDFLVTPTKTGRNSIGSASLTGRITPSGMPNNIGSFMDAFNQPGDNANFAVTPFTVASKPINITVKEPVKGVEPWLVAQQLDVKDEVSVNNQVVEGDTITVKAGEPFTRKIMMYAEGRFGNSLPDIERLVQNDNFKIYSDKPAEKGEIKLDSGVYSIIGKKAQNFNYIPQKEGSFELPEIKISWWSSEKDVLETATIPAKKITVTTAAATASTATNPPAEQTTAQAPTQPVVQQPAVAAPEVAGQQPAATTNTEMPASMKLAAQNNTVDANATTKTSSSDIDFETILMWLIGLAIAILAILKMFSNKPQPQFKSEPGLMRRAVTNEIKPKAEKVKEAFNPTSRKIIDSSPLNIEELNKVSSNNGCNVILERTEPSFFASITDEVMSVNDATRLQELMQKFAAENMGMKRTSNIIDIAENMVSRYEANPNIVIFSKQVDAFVFAGKPFEIEIAKNGIRKAMQEVIGYKPKKAEDPTIKDLDKLNPF